MDFFTFPTRQEAEQKCVVLASIPMNFATATDIMSHLKVTFIVDGTDFRIVARIYGTLHVYCSVFVLNLPHERIMNYLIHAFIMYLRGNPAAAQQLTAESAIVRGASATGCAILNTMAAPFEYGHPLHTLFSVLEKERIVDAVDEERMKSLERENDGLKKLLTECKRENEQLKALEWEPHEFKKLPAECEREKSLERENYELKRLLTECERAKEQVKSLERENHELKKLLTECEREKEQLKALEYEPHEPKTPPAEKEQVKALERENAKLKKLRMDCDREKTELMNSMQQMIKKSTDLERENEELKQKIATKNNQAVKALEMTVANKTQQIQMLLKEIEDLKQKCAKEKDDAAEIKPLQEEIAELKKTLKYERASHTKAMYRQTAPSPPVPQKHPIEPIAPVEHTAMVQFLQTTLVANYELCRENPTFGHCILMTIRQKCMMRQPVAERTTYMFEHEMGIEALDSASRLTPNQIAFIFRFRENRAYEMLRLVESKHTKYAVAAPPAGKRPRVTPGTKMPAAGVKAPAMGGKMLRHMLSNNADSPSEEYSTSNSEESLEEESHSMFDVALPPTNPFIGSICTTIDYNAIHRNSLDSFGLPLEDD